MKSKSHLVNMADKSMDILYYSIWAAFSFIALIHILLNRRDPAATIAWVLFVILVPIFGATFYYFFGPQRFIRRAIRRKREIQELFAYPPILPSNDESLIKAGLSEDDLPILNLARYVSEYPATFNNHVFLLPGPEATLQQMIEAIQSAKNFIHLEYYIFASDFITEQIFNKLIAAAKRGVEVRVLYDSLGSLFLKKFYFRKLTDQGIHIAGFLPIKSFYHRINLHFRNHRKILIIDGKTCFTGGTNIGKDYLGKLSPNQWHDYTVKVTGPVCAQLQDVFAKDWHFTTQEDLFHIKYYPEVTESFEDTVQVLESGPDSAFDTLHQAIFLAINTAKKNILLTTPYFVPDKAVLSALVVAARKGVSVSILLPSRNDSKVVQLASRSFYEDLLNAKVKIYEYQPRILHAKLLVIDDKWTMVGSANMDIRSFKLNFELNLLVHSTKLATQASLLFSEDLKQSKEVLLAEFKNRSIYLQLLENTARLFSPIL